MNFYYKMWATGTPFYRYTLGRIWRMPAGPRRSAAVIMLNPSTAWHADDPTIRSLVRILRHNGYNSLRVVNLFAYRATDWTKMLSMKEEVRVGPANNRAIYNAVDAADDIICAWGQVHKDFIPRQDVVVHRLRNLYPHRLLYCFGETTKGFPKHPLYLATKTNIEEYTYGVTV